MSTAETVPEALRDGAPFVAVMLLWILITGVIYGIFLVAWPDLPDAAPWHYFGVYLLPIIGYVGHTLQQALKRGRQ